MSQNGKSENHHDSLQREVLPIPNEAYAGPVLNAPVRSTRVAWLAAHPLARIAGSVLPSVAAAAVSALSPVGVVAGSGRAVAGCRGRVVEQFRAPLSLTAPGT